MLGPKISATAIFFFGVLLCSAPALAAGAEDPGAAATANTNDAGETAGQSPGNSATANGNSASSSQFAHELPFAANEGTMAESANTTALATSTYHQSTGFLPGIR
jgi:hypothetical protein